MGYACSILNYTQKRTAHLYRISPDYFGRKGNFDDEDDKAKNICGNRLDSLTIPAYVFKKLFTSIF